MRGLGATITSIFDSPTSLHHTTFLPDDYCARRVILEKQTNLIETIKQVMVQEGTKTDFMIQNITRIERSISITE